MVAPSYPGDLWFQRRQSPHVGWYLYWTNKINSNNIVPIDCCGGITPMPPHIVIKKFKKKKMIVQYNQMLG